MKVVKIERAMLAFAFFAVGNDEGTNFPELEADVKAEGGTVERVAGDLVTIHFEGTGYTLPLDFAIIISRGVGKVISKEIFLSEYISVVEEPSISVDEIVGRIDSLQNSMQDFVSVSPRLAALEKIVDKFVKASSKTDNAKASKVQPSEE